MCREADNNGRCPAGKTLNKDKTDMDNNIQCNIWLASQTFTDQLACYKIEAAAYCDDEITLPGGIIIELAGVVPAAHTEPACDPCS
mmetsp:Transcript_5303/g.4538  ORF Transcript_5303/g.4538 Transcript_5303/m.4538 type:complete len:86 (-) Transcript_5303:459-716(-)